MFIILSSIVHCSLFTLHRSLFTLQGLENVPPDATKLSKAADSKVLKDAMDIDEPSDALAKIDGETIATCETERGPQSTIHCNLSMLSLNVSSDSI